MTLGDFKQYSRQELLLIGKCLLSAQTTYRVPSSTWININNLGIGTTRSKPTRRGRKVGKGREHLRRPNIFTVASLNCRSVCNKCIVVHDYIVENHLDFICLTET